MASTDDFGTLMLLYTLAKMAERDKGPSVFRPGAATARVPGVRVWSEPTMRMFVEQMDRAGISPHVALLGIAAASRFDPTEVLGSNVGLLLVSREHLRAVGYVDPPPFETRDAVFQIPWIAKVIGARLKETGSSSAPDNVGDLAVLLHPTNPTLEPYVRKEANKRASDADGSLLYASHEELLRRVLANP